MRVSDYIFSGQRAGKPLSVMALEMVLRRMAIVGATVHGFRGTFCDWAGNETHFPRELAEHALAHVIGDKAEQLTGEAMRSHAGVRVDGRMVAILRWQRGRERPSVQMASMIAASKQEAEYRPEASFRGWS